MKKEFKSIIKLPKFTSEDIEVTGAKDELQEFIVRVKCAKLLNELYG